MKLKDLKRGETVYLDAEGKLLLGGTSHIPQTGQEAQFLRLLPGTKFVELRHRDAAQVGARAVPAGSQGDERRERAGPAGAAHSAPCTAAAPKEE